MIGKSVMLRDLEPLRKRLELLRSGEDEPLRKDADALFRLLQDSEGNLVGSAATLASAVRPRLGGMRSPYAAVVARLLDGMPEPGGSRPQQVAFLEEFSRRFEGLRVKGEAAEPAPFPESMTLAEMRQAIEDRNGLCRAYSDLFADLLRSVGSPDEWTRPLEIDGNSVLTDILLRELEPPPPPKAGAVADPVEPLPGAEAADPVVPPPPPAGEPGIPAVPPPPSRRQDASERLPEPEAGAAAAEAPASRPEAKVLPTPQVPTGGKRADVVFVVDASGSMRTCFDQLRQNIRRFVEPFREADFESLRLGLLAYSANIDRTTKTCVYRNIVLGGEGATAMKALYGQVPAREDVFFTRSGNGAVDVDLFMRRLDGVRCKGDEDTVFALDCAADFPFGPLESTRRVAVLFTDEKIEDGVLREASVGENFSLVEKVLEKFVGRHISLYAFTPASPVADMMSEFSRVFVKIVPEFRPGASDTWSDIDFGRMLEMMGRTVSSSLSGGSERDSARAVFGQDSWPDDRWA